MKKISLQIRNENYYSILDKKFSQYDNIINALNNLKQSGASGLFFYINEKLNGNKFIEFYPLTSIRARLNELEKNGDIYISGSGKSEKYNSTETYYRIKEQTKLF